MTTPSLPTEVTELLVVLAHFIPDADPQDEDFASQPDYPLIVAAGKKARALLGASTERGMFGPEPTGLPMTLEDLAHSWRVQL